MSTSQGEHDGSGAAVRPGPGDPHYPESRSRAYRLLVWTEHGAAIVLLCTLFALIIAQVFSRYVLGSPLSWTEELARFVFIWFTFTAAAFVAARRRHITVLLYGGGRTGRVVAGIEAAATAVVIVVSVAMTAGGIALMQGSARLISPGTGIPLSVVYAAISAGFALIALHSVVNLWLTLRHPGQFAGRQDIEKAGV